VPFGTFADRTSQHTHSYHQPGGWRRDFNVSERVAMADYTKREQRAAEMREKLARDTDARYTIFSNDFDPALRTLDLTLGQAIRVLQSRTGCTVYFERMDRGLGVGFRVPHDARQIAPTAGSVRINIVSRKADIVEAKKELVLACILGGVGGFRGLTNPVFKRHLRNLRMLVSLDPMAPAEVWNTAAKKCWPRELEDLKTYGARMGANVMRDQDFPRQPHYSAALGIIRGSPKVGALRMFGPKQTVFILGAGASWHYGYPTGERLVDGVIAKAAHLANYFEDSARKSNPFAPVFVTQGERLTVRNDFINAWGKLALEAKELHKRMVDSNPTLIDFFLAQNPDLRDIGRLAIALVMFDCEADSEFGRLNINHFKDYDRRVAQGIETRPKPDLRAFDNDWLKFVLHKITVRCHESGDLLRNRVNFVTFNYDNSLEQRLQRGLEANSLFRPDDIEKFLNAGRIFHMYGHLRENLSEPKIGKVALASPLDMANSEGLQDAMQTLQNAFNASLGLRTIDGQNKSDDNGNLPVARRLIHDADDIILLGYGFDEFNNERLALAENMAATRSRRIMFTNFGGQRRISKAAGQILFGNQFHFLEVGGSVTRAGQRADEPPGICEMSVRNVYDALAQDFVL
jgi:hypothetical protein